MRMVNCGEIDLSNHIVFIVARGRVDSFFVYYFMALGLPTLSFISGGIPFIDMPKSITNLSQYLRRLQYKGLFFVGLLGQLCHMPTAGVYIDKW